MLAAMSKPARGTAYPAARATFTSTGLFSALCSDACSSKPPANLGRNAETPAPARAPKGIASGPAKAANAAPARAPPANTPSCGIFSVKVKPLCLSNSLAAGNTPSSL